MNPGKGFLLLLIAVLLWLSYGLVVPFLQYFLIAGLLAFVLFPLQQRLEPRVGSAIALFFLILGSFIALIVPFLVIIATVADDAVELAQQASETDVQLEQIEGVIAEYTGQQIDIAQQASSYAEDAARVVVGSGAEVFNAALCLNSVIVTCAEGLGPVARTSKRMRVSGLFPSCSYEFHASSD